MKQVFLGLSFGLALGGCSLVQQADDVSAPEAGPVAASAEPALRPPAARPPANARRVEQFDTTSLAERQAAEAAAKAKAASGQGKALGRTVASLGDVTVPGLWLRTPLVSEAVTGRVVYLKTGKVVELDLRPIEGPKTAGSQISLAALRVLGAPLTDLSEVDVFQN